MPHGKLKKHFLSETILCSVYIMHFLLSSVFIKVLALRLVEGPDPAVLK